MSTRHLDRIEMIGVMIDLQRDLPGTVAALRAATPEIEDRRLALAEHAMHRVEIRRRDGSVAARGELISATVCGAHVAAVETGDGFVPLAEICEVVRLQPVRDPAAALAGRRETARREAEQDGGDHG